MNVKKLSINRICVMTTAFLLVVSVTMTAALYIMTRRTIIMIFSLLYVTLVMSTILLFVFFVRNKLIFFSDTICKTLDDMLVEEIEPSQVAEEENLFYKINHRLNRLYDNMRENRRSVEKERTDLKELISDISHQVKTPIANLKMINSTLLDQDVSLEKQSEFLEATEGQLDKLDFLMQTMIKTSRLETGIIGLDKQEKAIYNTIAAALGSVILEAEKKRISVEVDCLENVLVLHDSKWTCEALFNILDNAVKYTPGDGSVRVVVNEWEMYLRIDISDTGKGIEEKNRGAIFKRFYREKDVHEIEGLGIGLYLARKIITMQGGYIRVSSTVGEGSTFSVFLPMS